jgi:hypothetical protein
MAGEKVDLSTAGGDGSREAGTGIGLAVASETKNAEAAFLDGAVDALANLDAIDAGEEPPKKRRKAEAENVDEMEEQETEELDAEELEETDPPEEDEQDTDGKGAVDGEGQEDEPEAKVSIRLNGKKASLEDVLNHVSATVPYNGEDIEVSGEELIKGFMKGHDYSVKTTEMKRERDELMPYNQMVSYAKEDPQFQSYVQSYFQNGPFPELSSNPLIRTSDADLAKMLDQDDSTYDPKQAREVMRLRGEWQEKNANRQEVDQRAQADMQTRQSAWLAEQVGIAQQTINQMGINQGNEYKGEDTEYGLKSAQVIEFLKASGYNESEISGQQAISTSDARAAITAYKASEYDRMMRESDTPRITLGKKRKRPAPPRSQRSGSGTSRTTPSSRQQRDSFRKASTEQTNDTWVDALQKRLSS